MTPHQHLEDNPAEPERRFPGSNVIDLAAERRRREIARIAAEECQSDQIGPDADDSARNEPK